MVRTGQPAKLQGYEKYSAKNGVGIQMRKCNLTAFAILNFFIFYFVIGCSTVFSCEEKEVYRVTSPDTLVDAAIIEKDCGATTATSTHIYIVPNGAAVKKFSSIFVADHLKSLDVRWIKPKLLEIKYADARIFKYTNFWNSGSVDNFQYIVNIREYKNER